MGFLKKIIKYIHREKSSTFRKQVLQEKKQKYLFRDSVSEKYKSTRKSFFRDQKRKLAPFTDFFQTNLHLLDRARQESKILGYIGVFLVITSGYIIFLSPYFKVSPNNVLIEAIGEGVDMNIAYRALEDTYGKSLFFLDETEIAIVLKKYLKNTAHLTIDKLYPNGIKIIITGAPIQYSATIYGLTKKWGMTNNGVLIPESSTHSGELDKIEIISENLRNELFLDYKQIIPDDKMLILTKIIALFRSEWSGLTIGKLRFFEREDELHISLESGTKILLTLQTPNAENDYASRMIHLKSELSTLKQYIMNNQKNLIDGSITYIDARIPQKLFLCREKVVCTDNLIRIYGNNYQ